MRTPRRPLYLRGPESKSKSPRKCSFGSSVNSGHDDGWDAYPEYDSLLEHKIASLGESQFSKKSDTGWRTAEIPYAISPSTTRPRFIFRTCGVSPQFNLTHSTSVEARSTALGPSPIPNQHFETRQLLCVLPVGSLGLMRNQNKAAVNVEQQTYVKSF